MRQKLSSHYFSEHGYVLLETRAAARMLILLAEMHHIDPRLSQLRVYNLCKDECLEERVQVLNAALRNRESKEQSLGSLRSGLQCCADCSSTFQRSLLLVLQLLDEDRE